MCVCVLDFFPLQLAPFYFIYFFIFFKEIHVLIYWLIDWLLCWVFVSVRGLSLVAASGDHSSSRCAGLSLSRPLLLWSTGSRREGSAIAAHGPSCSMACGIFPDQGSNPCPLHWQADSQPLRHQGSPWHHFKWITFYLTTALETLNMFSAAGGAGWQLGLSPEKKAMVDVIFALSLYPDSTGGHMWMGHPHTALLRLAGVKGCSTPKLPGSDQWAWVVASFSHSLAKACSHAHKGTLLLHHCSCLAGRVKAFSHCLSGSVIWLQK